MNADCYKRILCVEDDEDSCEVLTMLLSQEGYEVIVGRTVAEGLRLAKEDKLTLIILDNWFLEGSGSELCRQIRAFNSSTPIIFYSGVGSDSDMQQAMSAGAQAYVVKPRVEQLLQRIVVVIHEVIESG